jgi:hypothetical protein
MSTPEPSNEAQALHASAKSAAEAMNLAGIYWSDSPAGCAEAHPEVFAALIQAQAQALHRLADALAPLERIAGAMETMAGGEDPPIEIRREEARQFAEEELEVMIQNASDPFPVQILPNGILVVRGTPTPDQLVEILRLATRATNILDESEPPTSAPQEPQEAEPEGEPAEPTTATTAPRGPDQSASAQPVASNESWRTGHPSANQACDGWVEVRDDGQLAALPDGRTFLVQHRHMIRIGEQWAPMTLVKSFTLRPITEPTTAPSAPQEPPQAASTTPGDHPLDQGGWIRSRVPTEEDGDEDGQVKAAHALGGGYFWCHWSHVVLGQPWCHWSRITPRQRWAPPKSDHEPLPTLQPLPAHIAYPESEGWIHDRVPGPEDGDEDGDVKIAAGPASTYIHWSHVVPGQPWQHTFA